jgi:hypothetical protein
MDKPNGTTARGVPTPADVMGYRVGAWQRSLLFLDVMRQRAEQDEAHEKAGLPHVLDFAAEDIRAATATRLIVPGDVPAMHLGPWRGARNPGLGAHAL